MKVNLTSVMVNDQVKARKFYTEVLGFVVKVELGSPGSAWLTVCSPESPEVQVLLEPLGHPAAKVFQKALYDDGIPVTQWESSDLQAEYRRLTKAGVKFRSEPKMHGPVMLAHFEDGCGNIIALVQPPARKG